MIPRIIHQTWRDENLPVPRDMPKSWKRLNPDWAYRFWTDDSLAEFVAANYPALEPIYQAVPNPVMRADIARYLLLHHFGGIYADIDTTCLASLTPLANETRIILATEPIEHWAAHAVARQMPYLVFNGIMASPKGHRFWLDVMAALHRCQFAKDVLDATGPLMLTGTVMGYDAPEEIALHSCHLFNLETVDGVPSVSPESGPLAPLRLATHHWAGSWVRAKPRVTRLEYLVRRRLWVEYYLSRGRFLSKAAARARVDLDLLATPLPALNPDALPNIAVLIPVRDGEPFLDRCFELLNALDYPKDRLSVTFLEGDSGDQTTARLTELIAQHGAKFRQMSLHHFSSGLRLGRTQRWNAAVQKKRRRALARVRNHLLAKGLGAQDDYALWLDVDVCDYPPDILHILLAEQAKIVTPDCTTKPGGRSYDMNAFLDLGTKKTAYYHAHALGGLFQPSAGYQFRAHLHDLRYLKRVPLNGVGGTMLLVHASVHRAGIVFPERPYRDLLETEGFGQWATDMGVQPIGLPQVEIRHVDS